MQSLSGGQKRRLDIALGLIHRPELLFLDEPSTGLDPHSRANLWEHIVELRRATGTTIFLTTHYLDEADQLAERVMVMDHGDVIADDTAHALKESLAGDRVTLSFTTATDAAAAAARIGGWSTARSSRSPRLGGDRALPRWIRELGDAGLDVVAATHRQPTLDDVFLALTGRSLREEAATPDADPAEAAGRAARRLTPVNAGPHTSTRTSETQEDTPQQRRNPSSGGVSPELPAFRTGTSTQIWKETP